AIFAWQGGKLSASRSRIRRMSYGYAPTPMPPMPIQRPSWFSRNWKWFVPTTIGGVILLFALFIGAIFALVFGAMKSSEPYQYAVTIASADARVVAQLGGPITPGWFLNGNMNVSGSSGNADLSIPLNGKLRHGTVYVIARKSAGVWHYRILQVAIDGNPERINLLTPLPPLLPPSSLEEDK
ncbi:MAG TPA: cytochrome c oxidase assembly factor Coa1 family protein, partial [Candidatus Angelobacter sp.]|nr:cytochrome c oxidase assembly factor Coa1 family protein [Candidatus Angelobacter sp.]